MNSRGETKRGCCNPFEEGGKTKERRGKEDKGGGESKGEERKRVVEEEI